MLELLARLHDLDGFLLTDREHDAAGSCSVRAEEELAVVSRAGRNRRVVGERRTVVFVDLLHDADERRRGRQIDANDTDLLDVLLNEGLRQQQDDAGAGGVERIRIRVGPVLVREVRRDPRNLRGGHRRRRRRPDPAVVVSFTVATTPASSSFRTHATAWSAFAPSSHVVTSMQEPLAPPRALNASADASSAVACSLSESTGDSKTVISPSLSGGFAVSHGPSSQRPMRLVVDLLGRNGGVGTAATTVVATAPARGRDERDDQYERGTDGRSSLPVPAEARDEVGIDAVGVELPRNEVAGADPAAVQPVAERDVGAR